MDQPKIERITAHAALSDARSELDQATVWAAGGDEDWRAWIDDLRAGLALVVRLHVTVEAVLADGEHARFHRENHSIWVEKHVDLPKVAEQLREVVGKDFGVLAEELQQAGLAVLESDLDRMYVEVRLDSSLRDELSRPPMRERGAAPRRRTPEEPG